jgi:hypothetical protein
MTADGGEYSLITDRCRAPVVDLILADALPA